MTFWEGKKVLITGVSGLIGAPLAARLLSAGADVLGYDTDPVGILRNYGIMGESMDIALGDIRDAVRLKEEMFGREIVFHLAAISGLENSRVASYEAYDINVMGAVAVLEAAKDTLPEAVVVASSNHVYGEHSTAALPMAEGHQLKQLDTYGVTKICADYITRNYAHNYEVPVATIRNTNCYGPNDPHSDHIIPSAIISLKEGHSPVIRGTGRTKKAYLYIEDVVRAYMMIAEWEAHKSKGGDVFNVSTDSISVLNLVNTIIKVSGVDVEPLINGDPDEQKDEHLDFRKVRNLVGWQPQYSLEEGLRLTWNNFAGNMARKAEYA